MIKTCEICQLYFELSNNRQQYCSDECRKQKYKVQATCRICEKVYNASKYNPPKFCSVRCSIIAQKGHQ